MKPQHFILAILVAAASTINPTPCARAQTNPVLIAETYWGDANHLELFGDYVILSSDAAPGYWHWIYNVSNPTNPTPVGPKSEYGKSLAVANGYAFVASEPHVLAYNISNPTNAVIVGTTTNSGAVVVSGNYAYLASGLSGLHIYDVSNPTNPIPVGHTTNNYGGFAIDVAVSGNYAFVANYTDGLRIFDVTNPTNPFSAGPSGLSTGAQWITVSGNNAYVGVALTNYPDYYGTTIYDISCPTNPVRGGRLNGFYGPVYGETCVSGNYLYLAKSDLWIFDVSDFKQPKFVGYYSSGGSELYSDVKVRSGYAYVSALSTPFFVFWLGAPSPPKLSIAQSGNDSVVLTWPAPTTAFSVQRRTDLSAGNWQTLTNTPVVVDSQNQVAVSAPSGTAFYRLIETQ